jgi:type II secretory pathway pseudopilin PulG
MMKHTTFRAKKRQRGYALLTTFGVMALLSIAAVSYVNRATQTVRDATRQQNEVRTTHLCEAGVQSVLRNLWRPFKQNQNFVAMSDACEGASEGDPQATTSGAITGVGRFSAGVIRYQQPNNDTYTRLVTVRAVGWVDRDNDGNLDNNEPRKVVDVTGQFQLARSQVFDYTYFVNNYGWMNGFNANDLIVNGDMRANGDFAFLNGSPTVNGSVYAALNEKLSPPAPGLVNSPPVKWSTSTYTTNWNNAGTANRERWRQPYDPARHGAKGTAEYEQWRDFVFDSQADIVNNRTTGAILADSTGYKSWVRTTQGATATTNLLDSRGTEEVIMPDLSDLSYYTNLSANYVDTKATYQDGTPNPAFGQGAYVEVWNQSLNGGAGAYQRISNNGVVNGSAVLIGTAARPIRIHGPVTFTEDALIKGHVSGQGTIYTGRNTHIVGSIRYSDKDLAGNVVGTPDFRGNNPQAIDNANEKRNMLGLAARGSVIMGKTTEFTNSYPLQYMTPPFTKGRYDENGNWIPPFNANEVDYTGRKRYQSVVSDATMNAIAEGINVLDCILYTNFVGGGNVGTGGGGVVFNGTIISKDEAMVVWSLPMRMNYDNRIRERSLSQTPLIDLQLPRSPTMLRSTWQDRGFQMASYGQ